jgi:hypothetical protein
LHNAHNYVANQEFEVCHSPLRRDLVWLPRYL